MKTMITKGIMAFAILALATSCSTSNDVASNRGIQKRKYNKGFFISKNTKSFDKKSQTKNTKQILVEEEVAEVINSQTETSNEMNSNKNISLDKNNNIAEQSNTKTSTNTTNFQENSANIKKNNTETTDNNTFENNTISKKDVNKVKHKVNSKSTSSGDDMLILLVILAFLIPFVAVGIKTDWDITKVLIALLLSIFFWIPGIIYALLIVFDKI